MGNRALRREASKLLGFKVYRGRKFAAFRYLDANRLRTIILAMKVPKGEIMHDCDGFNHRVGGHDVEKWTIEPVRLQDRRVLARIVALVDFHKPNGNPFCGCMTIQPYGKLVPSRAEIETYWREWIAYQGAVQTGFADNEYVKEIERRLNAGESICDEDGVELPELVELHQKSTF